MMASAYLLRVTLLLVASVGMARRQRNPVVHTKMGAVRGRTVPIDRAQVHEFLGIPYALKPVGELRFRPPQPEKERWPEVLEAVKPPNSCMQFPNEKVAEPIAEHLNPNTPVDEDCLYLNVITPNPKPTRAAVMVWIYGGGFVTGTSTLPMYDGKVLAGYNGIVFVSLQYRVGAFGFLSLGTDGAPGNAGLLDQKLALQWVKENIREFGGDPERITIFGESAGGSSVSFHLLAKESRNFFTRGIIQSGVANALWATRPQATATEAALKLAKQLECPHDEDDLEAVLTCLREVEAEKFKPLGDVPSMPFGPVDADPNFLQDSIASIMEKKSFYQTNVMVGWTADEGSIMLSFMMPTIFPTGSQVTLTAEKVPDALSALFPYLNPVQIEALQFHARNWSAPPSSENLAKGLSGIVSDQWFVCPSITFADTYAGAGQDTFVFKFNERPHMMESWAQPWFGVMHGSDIPYVFGVPYSDRYRQNGTNADRELATTTMTYWTNFAKTGDPNQDDHGSLSDYMWPKYAPGGKYNIIQYRTHQQDDFYGETSDNANNCAFWNHYIPKLYGVVKGDCNDGITTFKTSYINVFTLILLTAFLLSAN